MSSLWEKSPKRELLMLILTASALVCLPVSLRNLSSGTDAFFESLVISAVLCAWVLAASRLKSRLWPVLFFIGGLFGLLILLGNLLPAILNALRALWDLRPQLWLWWTDKIEPDTTFWELSLNLLGLRTWILLTRLGVWLNGIFRGYPVQDVVASNLLWGMFLWLVAGWAGWRIRRSWAVLPALFPTTIALAIVLVNTGIQKEILLLHLGALLILLGQANYDKLQSKWEKNGLDYAENISLDITWVTLLLATGLIMTAATVTTFSVKDIVDYLKATPTPARVTGGTPVPSAAAARPQPIDDLHQSVGGVGLPNSHLLGSGPELSQQPVMSISTGDLPPMPDEAHPNPPRYYWRAVTYSTYTGKGWENTLGSDMTFLAGQRLTEPAAENYRVVTQHVTFSGEPPNRLFWTGILVRANVPLGIIARSGMESGPLNGEPGMGAEVVGVMTSAKAYQAESLVPQVSVEQLQKSPMEYPAWVRETYLRLPASVPPRVYSLAADITAGQVTPYARAKAIEAFLRQFPYTLDVPAPPANRDVADYFLFDLQKGYCDYYATAMVVLARATGLPARMVAGYASGAYDSLNAEYKITQADAHAWVEIYFAGLGWVEFEATAGQPELVRPTGDAQPPEKEKPGLLDSLAVSAQAALPWIGLALTLGLLPFAGWTLYERLIEPRYRPERSIRRTYKRLRRAGIRFTGALPPSQTAWEFADALSAQLAARPRHWTNHTIDDIQKLTGIYTRMLFSPVRARPADALAAARLGGQIRWRLGITRFKK